MIKHCVSVGLGLAFLLSGLGGCSTGARREAVSAAPVQPREAVRIFGPRGERIAWGAMLETAKRADVVVIGETHGHPLGLAAAASLWDDLIASEPDAALAMEFFERDEQVALDDYLSGVTDGEQFRKAAHRSPGNYPPGHERMIEAAKAADRRVIAANAPRRYVRQTSADGYEKLEALMEEQKRLFVVPDHLVEGKYKDDFFGLMSDSGHGEGGEGGAMPPGMVEKMYRSQQLWDSTMADSVLRALGEGCRPVVLEVGRFHSDFDGGTVQFIQQRRPGVRVCTISMVDSDTPELNEDDKGRADFVVYVGPGPEQS